MGPEGVDPSWDAMGLYKGKPVQGEYLLDLGCFLRCDM